MVELGLRVFADVLIGAGTAVIVAAIIVIFSRVSASATYREWVGKKHEAVPGVGWVGAEPRPYE